MTQFSPIETMIAAEIQKAGGPITGRRFMEIALYHAEFGYYNRPRAILGKQGDFVTAPEMTSLFGALLALQWFEVWDQLGRPQHFQILEMGPGSGRLAADILRTARKFPGFFQALSYGLVEISAHLTAMQRNLLAKEGYGLKIQWYTSLESAAGDGVEGVIFSNEFLDALPVHWIEMTADGLREVGVFFSTLGRLETVTMAPTFLNADCCFLARNICLNVGMRSEIGVDAEQWVRRAGQLLKRGLILTIDYGYTASEYYAPARKAGTLVGHYRHERMDNPLLFPGEMDLTAHVDFSAVARSGELAGLDTLGYTTQAWFLLGLGILEHMDKVQKSARDGEFKQRVRDTIMRLILPEEMGERFKVLAQGRGLEGGTLAGFRLNDQRSHL